MKRLSIRILASLLVTPCVAFGQATFQEKVADMDEKAAELQRRLLENEQRLQRHAEALEAARARLEALRAGQPLPPRSATSPAPPTVTPEPAPPIEPPQPPQPLLPPLEPVLPPHEAPPPPTSNPDPVPRNYRIGPGPMNYYFQLRGGYVVPEKEFIPSDGRTADYEDGYSVGAGVGADFGPWRVGLELGRRGYDDTESGWGHAENNYLMAQLGWDVSLGEGTELFFAGSAGPNWCKLQRPSTSGNSSYEKSLLGYQISVGLGHRFTEALSARIGYNYLTTTASEEFGRLGSHGVDLSLNFDL